MRAIFLFLLASHFGFSTCDVYSEIKYLKDGQTEIKDLLKKVLYRIQGSNSSASTSYPGLSSSGTEEWFSSGCSAISASKTTRGDEVRLQIEMSFSLHTIAVWGVGRALIGADEKNFGASLKTLSKTTLFTLDVKKPLDVVYFITFSDDEMVTSYMFDTTNEDGTTNFENPITCQSSFSKISDSEYDSFYRCVPELDPRNSWFMEAGIFASYESEVAKYWHIETNGNKYFTLTTERNSTARATVHVSDETMERIGDFIFLQSSLSLPADGVLKSMYYRRVYDISKKKTMKEFKFLEPMPQEPILEGDLVPINCEAIGRNPPPIQVKRNGERINSSESVSIIEDNTNLWSTTYVTFLHASNEIEGNYSCVAETDGEQLTSPLYTEVKLHPRILWDLTKILKREQNQTSVRVAVEGAKGITLNCSSNSWSENENRPVSTEKRTKISEWNERLEVDYTWKRKFSSYSTFLSCIAKDRNDEVTFDHTYWQ